MKKIRITKEFKFEMAHALYGYDGPCKNIHGHSYRLLVTLIGEVNNDKNQSEYGMVIDFSHIKEIVRNYVIRHFDHALMLQADSPHGEMFREQSLFNNVLLVPYQPTSENILLDVVERIRPELPGNVQLHHIQLWETATSYAEWYNADN